MSYDDPPPPPPPPRSVHVKAKLATRDHSVAILFAVALLILTLCLLAAAIGLLQGGNGNANAGSGADIASSPLSNYAETDNPPQDQPPSDSLFAENEQALVDMPANDEKKLTDYSADRVTEPSDKTENDGEQAPDRKHIALPNYSGVPGSSDSRPEIGKEGYNPFVGNATQESVVFVLDKSSSMSLESFERICHAVVEALKRLDEDQEFLVILFDDVHRVFKSMPRLDQATPERIKTIEGWLSEQLPSGGTVPLSAMEYALSQSPSRIVLLSDGEFEPSMADEIAKRNKANPTASQIDTIGLIEDVVVLRRIASENNGTYFPAR